MCAMVDAPSFQDISDPRFADRLARLATGSFEVSFPKWVEAIVGSQAQATT